MKNNKKDGNFIRIDGIDVFSGTRKEALGVCVKHVTMGRGVLKVSTPNPEQMVLLQKKPEFRLALSQSFNLPDGAGLIWALKRLYPQMDTLQRIPGRSIFHELLLWASQEGHSVFFLGGRHGSAQKIINLFRSRSQKEEGNLLWSFHKGAQRISQETQEEERQVLSAIRQAQPELLFIAYGAPWQELWMQKHTKFLEENGVRLVMVVGGSFEYESGVVPMVFPIVEKLHLEWLQRLLWEPWRWKRQMQGLQFFWWILTGRIGKEAHN